MANIPAVLSNSDFNNPATWQNGIVPGLGDVAYANGQTVLTSGSITVQALTNASASGIAAGGTFSLQSGLNLNCTNANGIIQGATGTSVISTPNLSAGNTATVAANCELTVANGYPLNFNGSGILNWIGNFSKGNIANILIAMNGNGAVNITGNVTNSVSNIRSVDLFAGTLTITGTCTGILLASTNAGATMTINGLLTPTTTGPCITNTTAATITYNGVCQSSTTQPVFGLGSTAQNTRISGPVRYGSGNYINPIPAARLAWSPSLTPTSIEFVQADGVTLRSLYTADNMPVGGYPVNSNVVASIVYGPNSEFIGTAAMPAPSSVAQGVAVGATVGTAVLTPANVRAALGMASGNLDAQLAEKATVDEVGAIVQGAR
jgi:hypothetical protein